MQFVFNIELSERHFRKIVSRFFSFWNPKQVDIYLDIRRYCTQWNDPNKIFVIKAVDPIPFWPVRYDALIYAHRIYWLVTGNWQLATGALLNIPK